MSRGLLFAFLAAFCWGVSPVLQKRALKDMGLLELNAVRGIGMLTVLLPALFFLDAADVHLGVRSYSLLALMALLINIVGDLFVFAAIRSIGVSLTSPIASSYPLLVTFFSWRFFGEDMTAFVWGGTLLVVAGLVFLNIRKDGSGGRFHVRGVTMAALAALCWALGLGMNKTLALGGVSSTGITCWRGIFFGLMGVGCWALSSLLRPGSTERLSRIPAAGWLAGIGAAWVALLVGGWFYASSLFMIPLSVATPIASSSPLIAALIACMFMDERLRPLQWLGILFVISGAVLVGM